jgi:hypothetical protein
MSPAKNEIPAIAIRTQFFGLMVGVGAVGSGVLTSCDAGGDTLAPQDGQNSAFSGSCVPHPEQMLTMTSAPHDGQNFAFSGSCVPHSEQMLIAASFRATPLLFAGKRNE